MGKGHLSPWEKNQRAWFSGLFRRTRAISFPSLSCECLVCEMGTAAVPPTSRVVEGNKWVHSSKGLSDYEVMANVNTQV